MKREHSFDTALQKELLNLLAILVEVEKRWLHDMLQPNMSIKWVTLRENECPSALDPGGFDDAAHPVATYSAIWSGMAIA